MVRLKKIFIVALIALLVLQLFTLVGCNNQLEGDLLEFGPSYYSDVRTSFYCAGKVKKEIPNQGKFSVEFSFGVLSPEEYENKARRYIEITAYNHKGDSYFLKKVSGSKFYTEDYAYYPTESGMAFKHTEILKIPVSFLEDEEGWFNIIFVGYDRDDPDHVDGLDGTKEIKYFKNDQKIYFTI